MALSRVEAAGDTGGDEGVLIPSDLVGSVQDAVIDYQVSSDPEQLRPPSLSMRYRSRNSE